MPDASGFQPIILTNLNIPWEAVLNQGTAVSFPRKTIISARFFGGSVSGMYYIKNGCVYLSYIMADGREKIMFYMGPGTIFNEIPMLQSEISYLFSCIEDTEAVFFPKKRIIDNFIRHHPNLILNLMESMSFKSLNFYTQLGWLRVYSTYVNVCRILYSMHLFNRNGDRIVPRLTQQELAAFLGVHRSSLHKALSRLQVEGIIGKYSRNELELRDPERLLAYCEGGR